MKSIFVLLSTDKITKTISLKVFKILDFKIMENRLSFQQKVPKFVMYTVFLTVFQHFVDELKH